MKIELNFLPKTLLAEARVPPKRDTVTPVTPVGNYIDENGNYHSQVQVPEVVIHQVYETSPETLTETVMKYVVHDIINHQQLDNISRGIQSVGGYIPLNNQAKNENVYLAIRQAYDHFPVGYREKALIMAQTDIMNRIRKHQWTWFDDTFNPPVQKYMFIEPSLDRTPMAAMVINPFNGIIIGNEADWINNTLVFRYQVLQPAAIKWVKWE